MIDIEEILDCLFDRIRPLATLSGYQRESVREEMRREIDAVIDRQRLLDDEYDDDDE